jgi:hypothetical protein
MSVVEQGPIMRWIREMRQRIRQRIDEIRNRIRQRIGR